MTNAGFGALAVTLRAIVEPGDEVIFLSPPWFFYELLIAGADAVPVRLARAAGVRPRPWTPSPRRSRRGRGRSSSTARTTRPAGSTRSRRSARWRACSTAASRRNGRTIHLIADEPYHRIVFDGIRFHSAAEVYPGTIITYSYGKTLLAPGQRLGYIAVPPTSPERRRSAGDRAVPVGHRLRVPQRAAAAQRRRPRGRVDRRRRGCRPAATGWSGRCAMGYETTNPEGTFYILAMAPIDDDQAFGAARRTRRARPAGDRRGAARLGPRLADGLRRDGRAGPPVFEREALRPARLKTRPPRLTRAPFRSVGRRGPRRAK